MPRDAFAYAAGRLVRIEGTLEMIPGMCGVDPTGWEVGADGHPINTECDGNGTEMFWDDTRTATTDAGHRVYLDEDGNHCPAPVIVLEEVDADGAPIDPPGALARAKAAADRYEDADESDPVLRRN